MNRPLTDLTAQCIRCGFCLESCPTFLESGSEAMSPRGRIHLAKLADCGEISWADPDLHRALDTCVGCRACETACPSGVEYGQILEIARARQKGAAFYRPRRTLLNLMANGRLGPAMRVMPGRRMPAMLSRVISGQTPEADMPFGSRRSWPPMRDLPEIQGEVYLMEGCVAGTTFPAVQEATRRVLRRAGFAVRPLVGCCGALHTHAGMEDKDDSWRSLLRGRFDSHLPLITNTAGCGSHLKACGVERVFDISEFLADVGFEAVLRKSAGLKDQTATYHDACHLAHGQRLTQPPRRLLEAVPGLVLTPLRESGLCCGSGGVYNLFQPEMARRLLERKWANIEATEASLVVLGNPGCHAWIAQAAREHGGAVRVMHTVEVLEAAFSGMPP